MIQNERATFFTSRWQGEADLQLLLWRDVLVVGTLINLVAGLAAFILLTRDVTPVWALAVHLSPVPYNIFLLLSVWRSRQATPTNSFIATIWFALVLII